MRGIAEVLVVVILLLVVVALLGAAWFFISLQYETYTAKIVTANIGGSYCQGRAASITINNVGTASILASQPPPDFAGLGNIIPNPGFEEDANGNGKPDYWEGLGVKEENVHVVLVSDLSNSMSDCMDSQSITPDGTTVLLLHFDDQNNPMKDSSGWGNDGIVQGATASWTQDGRFGGGMHFVYEDNVTVPFNDSLTNLTAMTVETWIKFDKATTRSAIISGVGSSGANSGYTYGVPFELYMQDGKYISFLKTKMDIMVGSSASVGEFYLMQDRWYHLAATWTGDRIKIYINGTKLADTPLEYFVDPIFTRNMIVIGSRGWVSVNGTVDEVAIYNRVLSDSEIASHAKALKSSSATCPSDGKPDMPAWCRHETSLCPASGAMPDEAYLAQYAPPAFRTQGFDVATESAMTALPCTEKATLLKKECYDSGFSFNRTLYTGCTWVTRTTPGVIACAANQQAKSWAVVPGYWPPKVYNYPSVCTADEERMSYDGCVRRVRADYSVPTCGLSSEWDIEDRAEAFIWKSACASPQELDKGQRMFGTYECREGQCSAGWQPCTQCNSCQGSQTCCCRSDSLLMACENMTDLCCNKVNCIKYMDECCTVSQECCDGGVMCKRQNPVQLDAGQSCTPGLSGGVPSVINSCGSDSISLCTATGGSCYYCSSVAIRLLKKLDEGFVTSMFRSASNNASVGLVSYGTAVSDWIPLTMKADQGTLTGGIGAYHADRGETCISCAIQKAAELLSGSTADHKYIVLMSDGEANRCIGNPSCTEAEARQEAVTKAQEAASLGVVFYTIGFGKDAGAATLQQIAAASPNGQGKYFQGSSPEELSGIYRYISQTISNARTSDEKVYGAKSLLLNNHDNPPSASSLYFADEGGGIYNFSFFRKLSLQAGLHFNVSVLFFDSMFVPTQPVSSMNRTYTGPIYDTALAKDSVLVNVPANTKNMIIKFEFNETESAGGRIGEAIIDDLYMGPVVTCVREGDGYRCGEFYIIKTSSDGDLYPYFDRDAVSPRGALILKDANCQGRCSYRISTTSSTAEASVTC